MHFNANHTIYVKNLCTKVKKPELRRSLFGYFCPYGRILDIVALKTKRERGQAFITFSEPNSASAALRDCNGKMMYDKPLVIEFAKTKSRVIAMMDGTWESQKAQRQQQQQSKMQPSIVKPSTVASLKRARAESEEPTDEDLESIKKQKQCDEDIEEISPGEPHNVLFVKNLPQATPSEELIGIFSRYDGYLDFRPVPGKPDFGFIEFESIDQSCVAQTSLHGMRLKDQSLIVTFSKKHTDE